jgi:hypothetical protein
MSPFPWMARQSWELPVCAALVSAVANRGAHVRRLPAARAETRDMSRAYCAARLFNIASNSPG